MSHLARQQIRDLVVSGSPRLVDNVAPVGSAEFDELLQPDSIDLRIGSVVAGGVETVAEINTRTWQLPSGEMAIVITREAVNMPANLAAEVSPTLSVLNDGILILAAPHVDPGYRGPLTARVINLRDKAYALTFEKPVLTVRFYRLEIATDRPYSQIVSAEKKVERAIRESRDTFNRLFLREEEFVKRSELKSAAFTEALTWLALLIPAIFVVAPFSAPFFWSLGMKVVTEQPEWARAIGVAAGLFLLPLAVIYIVGSMRLIWMWCSGVFTRRRG